IRVTGGWRLAVRLARCLAVNVRTASSNKCRTSTASFRRSILTIPQPSSSPNDTAQQRRGNGELEGPEKNQAPPPPAGPCSAGVLHQPGLPLSAQGFCRFQTFRTCPEPALAEKSLGRGCPSNIWKHSLRLSPSSS